MNQNNGKNSIGLDSCFEDLDNPIDLFKKWFDKAKVTEINDPNAVALGTADINSQPSIRMVLLKGLSNEGFVFYTNFNSKKGGELKNVYWNCYSKGQSYKHDCKRGLHVYGRQGPSSIFKKS